MPLEWFTWERIIIDECHESLVMGQEEAETRADATSSKGGGRKERTEQQRETQGHREKRKCAQRELLGIGVPDPRRRPLRARRSTWGLTGTPLLSNPNPTLTLTLTLTLTQP